MKKILTLLTILVISLPTLSAQGRPQNNDEGWKERVNAQKVAFITLELGLTSEEAQAFWPVYYKYSELNAQLGAAVMDAYRELDKALKDNENVEAKLDAYTKALDARSGGATQAANEYKKVLPAEKVAKLYMADENFRRMQIERLHNGGPANQPAPPQNNKRMGKGPQAPQNGPQPPQPRSEE